MNKVTLAVVPLLLLIACGSDNGTPLEKNNTAQDNSPSNESASQDCGTAFSAERSINKLEFNSVYWQANSEALQPKPEFRLYADKNSLGATHSISSDIPQCVLAANIFGSTSAQTWQGDSNASFKQGELVYYSPELIFKTALPEISSLKDWRNKGRPETVSQPIESVNITIHYRDKNNSLITFGEDSTNTGAINLACNKSTFDLTLKMQPVVMSAQEQLDKAFCEEVQIGLDTELHCLSVGINQETGLESCQFELTTVILPDQNANKSTVKVAGVLEFSAGTADLEIKDIKL
ncbi:hypothetical protein [Pseudoalteromonas luteoviolacea]|uniref:Lipoprotein n=1 Tax=Pseudoalteromonas luteoviolacea S4054 TaxID=1129367 RepID=A0A0F6ACL5_9GAMM|nr:hypothetical protein [Pseudoalteromonas luteoviolacea]AOT09575.1 hypothetical protein S4054249_17890 [Pseudoalteromonas luteoviolacea]AOT14487.1 hypothetical protein S40542_17860 [Pseudoalteromonas luteoviolacea]AOT19402.1 hypothetical protein S4054_17865 [Pseudoalteromonas luteoviolacea]KKE83566.1 hypothetical protein N479_13430 [Pseudoalteromonas luteoviolacea S4054]KZN69139.1 hypothetical protein N481_22555 [Pseudoalteromonas luteoviolacea S4047-1]